MGVTEVMEPDMGKPGVLGNPGKRVGNGIIVVRLSIQPAENIVIISGHEPLRNQLPFALFGLFPLNKCPFSNRTGKFQ